MRVKVDKLFNVIDRMINPEYKKKFNLVDYKGKFDIIVDEVNEDWEVKVGEITKKEAIDEATERKANARYYGVSAYIGEDKELNKIYNI
jgi:TPP-dependent trihydroxycyclohexane-1,2-dione (THcHDO) dehydratase